MTQHDQPATSLSFSSSSVVQTQRLGATLARLLEAGDIIWLEGDLGAGKTTLTKGIAQGLGVVGYVNSPTFTLVNQYQGRLPVFHLDCYRLESSWEALDFGIEEYLDAGGVTIIEWPERIRDILPPERLLIGLEYLDETERLLRLEAFGARYERLVRDFEQAALQEQTL